MGENGAGKSTILDALKFVLFGKPFRRINKPQLINSVNGKEMVVEIVFSADNQAYKIVRGMKPNIFEIYRNGQLIDQNSTSLDYQDYLNTYILKMTAKSFEQIVVLGSASFVPFMQLTPADRRLVIEDLLDIQVFSIMAGITKLKLQDNKEQFQQNLIKIDSTVELIELIEKNIKSLQENANERIAAMQTSIISNEAKIQILEREISDIQTQRQQYAEQLKSLPGLLDIHKKLIALASQIENNIKKHKKDVEFYEHNDACPTCRQMIDLEFKKSMVLDKTNKISDITSGLSQLEKKQTDNLEKIESLTIIQNKDRQLAEDIILKQTMITSFRANVVELQKTINDHATSNQVLLDNQQALKDKQKELADLENHKAYLLENRQYLDVAINLLKDTGIKSKIIKQYIPIINKQVNSYLTNMGFFVDFHINENFEETIRSRYRDEFSYQNFSEGEKMRIDLAILFTWRKVARLKNSVNTNLLILDEIFDSSLDGNGIDDFLKIMMDMLDGTNTFVISHKTDALLDKFERTILFSKKNNFSRIVSEKGSTDE